MAAAIWKIEKSQYLHYGWTNLAKFGMVCASILQTISATHLKIQHGGQLPSGESKKKHISKIICTNFS